MNLLTVLNDLEIFPRKTHKSRFVFSELRNFFETISVSLYQQGSWDHLCNMSKFPGIRCNARAECHVNFTIFYFITTHNQTCHLMFFEVSKIRMFANSKTLALPPVWKRKHLIFRLFLDQECIFLPYSQFSVQKVVLICFSYNHKIHYVRFRRRCPCPSIFFPVMNYFFAK